MDRNVAIAARWSRGAAVALALVAVAITSGCREDDPGESVVLTGTLQDSGLGCWVLKSGTDTYELMNLPDKYRKAGLAATVKGKPRPDMASICMVGPIVEILQIEESAK
jgi:hypothetical protein